MAKGYRVRNVHGVYIPPRKEETFSRAITIPFVLTGVIPSKKNGQRLIIPFRNIIRDIMALYSSGGITVPALIGVFKKNKGHIRPSKKYEEWHKQAKQEILRQAQVNKKSFAKYGLEYPIIRSTVHIHFYWSTNLVRDNSNKQEGIQDLLRDCGIIVDDSWQHFHKHTVSANLYRGQITDHITEINLTAYVW